MDMVLNIESLMRRLGNDRELLIEILELFIGTMPKHVNNLKTAIKEKNLENIKREAHVLKGAAGNISAEKLANTAAALESTGKDGDLNSSKLLFPVLLEEYIELEKKIEQLLDSP